MTQAVATACFHCGQPATAPLVATGQEVERVFCCHGCRQAAELVQELGLAGYYEQRTGFSARPRPGREFPFDDPAFAAALVREAEGLARCELLVAGLHCAACVWLIEQTLLRHPAVVRAQLYLSSGRLEVTWKAGEWTLSELVGRVEALGYQLSPYDATGQDRRARRTQTALLIRVGVAGLAALATGFVADPVNATVFDPWHAGYRTMFVALGFGIGTPALAYVIGPFLKGAISALRARRLTMDVSITLAALATWLASLWGMVAGGPLYFDCALSFLFLLLAGRFVEGWARRRVFSQAEGLWRAEAPTATLLEDGVERAVPTAMVRVGDRLRLRPGDRIPVDGLVESGQGAVDEAMLTGEALPVLKQAGSEVSAGTLNCEGALVVRATRVGTQTTLAQIVRWVEEADAARSPSEVLANKVSTFFLPILLVVAGLTFALNLHTGLDPALRHTISVLIVTCPCALGLATPAAIAVAMARGARDGVLFKSGTELERLRQLTEVVFDKTGTVTTGQMSVVRVVPLAPLAERELLAMVASLEACSEHPLARAVVRHARALGVELEAVGEFRAHPGQGVEGTWRGRALRVGTASWLGPAPVGLAPGAASTPMWVALDRTVVGLVEVADTLRSEAPAVVAALRARGIRTQLVSGDRREAVEPVAAALGVCEAVAQALPVTKRERLEALRASGKVVGMVGDGLNDAPAMALADVGVAMGRGAALTATAAHVVLLGDRLDQLLAAMRLSERTVRTIGQNFGLSALYNALVVPAAALGYISPQAAALLMPASSLLVLANSLRLAR